MGSLSCEPQSYVRHIIRSSLRDNITKQINGVLQFAGGFLYQFMNDQMLMIMAFASFSVMTVLIPFLPSLTHLFSVMAISGLLIGISHQGDSLHSPFTSRDRSQFYRQSQVSELSIWRFRVLGAATELLHLTLVSPRDTSASRENMC